MYIKIIFEYYIIKTVLIVNLEFRFKLVDKEKIEQSVINIIQALGDDVNREGLKDTPKRVSKMYDELFSGINKDPGKVLLTDFEEAYDDIVIIKDLQFFSICEHHFLPFFGVAHVSYIPNGKVVGASKLYRSLEILARRPQIQERLTNQFVNVLNDTINPKGVGLILEAEHLCMSLRGIRKQGSKIITSQTSGLIKNDPNYRNDFFSLTSS